MRTRSKSCAAAFLFNIFYHKLYTTTTQQNVPSEAIGIDHIVGSVALLLYVCVSPAY
jgi:hypothetical protein